MARQFNFVMARQLHDMHFKVAQYLACLELWRVRTMLVSNFMFTSVHSNDHCVPVCARKRQEDMVKPNVD